MRVRRLMLLLGLATGLVLSAASSPVRADDVDGDGVDDFSDVCDNTPVGTAVDDEGRPLGDLDQDCDNDLEDYTLSQQGFTGPLAPPGVVIDTVTVGNPGNANDTEGEGYGAVGYEFHIGKYEVTAGQYTEFLNAVAATDTYGLYNWQMWEPLSPEWEDYGCQIERHGTPSSYSYSIAADWADRPVNYVSWGDAARFANWLHNGQPTDAQDLSTTEDGSYFLNGATSDAALLAVVRESDATWVIPSEDEWYKAAYHKNDGATSNYYDYPTSSDSPPSNDITDPDAGNNATFYDSGYTIGSPYYRTEVGAHENSESPYDTFDQGGNVWEWNEPRLYPPLRVLRGGCFSYSDYPVNPLHAESRYGHYPSIEGYGVGFRVAEVP